MKKFSKRYLLALLLPLAIACGLATTSPLVKALVGISIATDVGAPVVATLDPAVAGLVGLVPPAMTAALDVAEGKTLASSADTVIAQFKAIIEQAQKLIPGLTGNDVTIANGILNATQQGLTLFEAQYPPTPAATTSLIARGYANGFFDSPNPKAAKVKKLGPRDRLAVAEARKHVANVVTALKGRPVAANLPPPTCGPHCPLGE